MFYRKKPVVIEAVQFTGQASVDVGDYIIKGVEGEFYPCKPDIFAQTYEKVVS